MGHGGATSTSGEQESGPESTTDCGLNLMFGLYGQFWRACVLLVLADGPTHGYKSARKVVARGYGQPDVGGLYRALRAMEEEGLVTSSWEFGEHGPARHVYTITDQGLAALDDLAAAALEALQCLDRLLYYERRVNHGPSSAVPGLPAFLRWPR